MKKALLYFISFLLIHLFSYSAFAEKTKQAMRAYDKGDFEKVEDILLKSMEDDSLNPATEYVWALLYSNKNYPNFHVDTAHFYIEQACMHIQLQNEDHLDELEDADLYEYDLKNKKMAIDSVAFAIALDANNVNAYQHFIDLYEGAAEFDQAVSLRNQLVFRSVESEHTWKAYAEFIEKYPDAIQVEKAQIQYDKLIFEEKTKSGKLADLEQFLVREPETPYRHAIEKRIFEDYVGELEADRIVAFYNKYKNPILSDRALNMLYYLEDISFSDLITSLKVKRSFLDSVATLEELNRKPLAISNRNNGFQFVNLKGELQLEGPYDGIQEEYRCGNILDELIAVQVGGAKQLINRNGDVIFDGYDGQVKRLGNGLLAVEENDKIGVIHISGFRLLEPEYESLSLVDNSFLVFEENEKLGVMSITGKVYVKPAYDEIFLKGTFWVFRQGDVFGVSNRDQIKRAKDQPFEVKLPFEEVELINDKYIIGFEEETEVLINWKLEHVTPEATKRINTRHETWVVELPDGYTTFDPEMGQLSSNVYQSVLQNSEWLALTRNGKWFVYNKNIYDEPIIGVDSVKLLGEDIAIVFRGQDGMAIFPNKKVVEIVENQFLKSIGPKIQADSHFLVVKERGDNILYKDGMEQFRFDCDELGYISDSAFFVRKNGKYGAVGLDGRLIMRIRYDAISEAENEVAPVLYNGKFGAYNFRDRVLLNLDYQEKIKPYNDELFVVNEGGDYGLLDKMNSIRVKPDYEQIEYWSDTTFLGLKDGNWHLITMNDENHLLSDVLYYEYLKNSPEEKILLIRTEEGYGVYHSTKGLIIPAVFHDVMNLGNDETQLYFTETAVSEADIYVVVYYDTDGNKLFSEAYRESVYETLVCED